MSDLIEIHWTAGNLDEARRVSRYLVQERLVACAQIIPWIESVYMWNNQLETSQETKVALKTRQDLYAKIKKTIEENSTYDVPEITYVNIDGGNQAYLDWAKESMSIAKV